MKQEKLKTCFFPCTHAMTVLTERWLSRQAAEGWKLYGKKLCFFTFIKAKEANIEYFMYSGFGSERGLSYDFLRARDRYEKKNSNIKMEFGLFEADPNKIDNEFYQYRSDRNRYYKKHYFWVLFLLCILTLFGLIVVRSFKPAKLFLILLIPVLAYYGISWLILLSTSRDRTEKS